MNGLVMFLLMFGCLVEQTRAETKGSEVTQSSTSSRVSRSSAFILSAKGETEAQGTSGLRGRW